MTGQYAEPAAGKLCSGWPVRIDFGPNDANRRHLSWPRRHKGNWHCWMENWKWNWNWTRMAL